MTLSGPTLQRTFFQGRILRDTIRSKLVQLHFHNPSEHRFDSFASALESTLFTSPPPRSPSIRIWGIELVTLGFLDVVGSPRTIPRSKDDSVLVGTQREPLRLDSVVGLFSRELENDFPVYDWIADDALCSEDPFGELVLPFSAMDTQLWTAGSGSIAVQRPRRIRMILEQILSPNRGGSIERCRWDLKGKKPADESVKNVADLA
ncbi:hypothetical protein BJ742DRAFT_742361 [Cladochytrium replicatum]|nr:hypothetical protein BJ742DRAFT_742361 [Cladochytrium replicatum]